MRDQDKFTYDSFRGMWNRGDDDACPPDHFLDCLNLKFDKNSVESRDGFRTEFSTVNAVIYRMAIYRPLTGVPHRIVLYANGANSDLYDIDVSTAVPILAGIGPHDFSMVNMYGRAYLVFHDRVINSPISPLYLYNGTTARLAGGAAPTSTLVETAVGAGKIEVGDLLLTYSFETDSGFITKSYATPIRHTFAAANNSITVTVPTGPAGTVARRLIACKTVPLGVYNGDPRTQKFYFVPGNGRIGDNVTTSVVLTFFNSELIDSADYLADNITNPPGGLLLGTYGTRLVLGGDATFPHIVRFSEPGNPEAFSAVSGFITVDPSEMTAITNGWEWQGSYVVTKRRKTYITSDTGSSASKWPVDSVDGSVGTECFGVSVVADATNSWKNITLVADQSGLMIFDGTYNEIPLTDKIKDWWGALWQLSFDRIQVVVDAAAKRVYCLVPRLKAAGAAPTYCNHILVGDFQYGLDPVNIIWSPWALVPAAAWVKLQISCIMMDYDTIPSTVPTIKPRLKIASDRAIIVLTPDVWDDYLLTGNVVIPSYARFSYTQFDDDDSVCTFIMAKLRASGLGKLNITLTPLDVTLDPEDPRSIFDIRYGIDLLTSVPHPIDKLVNFTANRASMILHQGIMNLGVAAPQAYWCLNKAILYGKATWASLPSLTSMRT